MNPAPHVQLSPIGPGIWEAGETVEDGIALRLVGSRETFRTAQSAELLRQFRAVASLPGVVGPLWAMPNCRPAVAFPYGCVVATDPDMGGVVTPWGGGVDPYCGVRLMTCPVSRIDLEKRLRDLMQGLARRIPVSRRASTARPLSGVGPVLFRGAHWAVEQGFGHDGDLARIEQGGRIIGADAAVLSPHARAVGEEQLGTLGTGYHFIEVGFVEALIHPQASEAIGLIPGTAVVWIHTGSRGLGQQILAEYQRVMERAAARHLIRVADRQLHCAPVHSHEGREYLAAMAASANFAFANRQILAQRVRDVMTGIFGEDGAAKTVYEQCHNTVSLEVKHVDGIRKRLCIHRRAASRMQDSLEHAWHGAGQPVLLPGHCTSASYVGVTRPLTTDVAWGSVPSGAGQEPALPHAEASHGPLATTLRLCVQSGRFVTLPTPAARDVHALAQSLDAAGAVRWAARVSPLAVLRG